MVDCGGGVFYRAGEKVERMDDMIALADGGLGKVVVHKLNSVRKKECLGDGIGYMEAVVMVEFWTNVEAFASAEVPIFPSGWLVVDHDWKPHGTNGCGIEVEGPIVVLPGRHGRGNVGLAKEIQGEICLG